MFVLPRATEIGHTHICVHVRDIAYDIHVVIENGERGHTLTVHELKRLHQWFVAATHVLAGRPHSYTKAPFQSYLMDTTGLEPIFISANVAGSSCSTAGNILPCSQKKLTSRSCVSTATASLVPPFVMIMR